MPTECSAKPMGFARVDGRAVIADFGGGIACAPAGLVVVDIDDCEAWERWLTDQGLIEPKVIMRSGGRHQYFRARAGRCTGVRFVPALTHRSGRRRLTPQASLGSCRPMITPAGVLPVSTPPPSR